MFVIVTYDIEKSNNQKILKLLRRYLYRRQNSVFDGQLTPKQLKELKTNINICLKHDDVSKVIIYKVLSEKEIQVDLLGKQEYDKNIII